MELKDEGVQEITLDESQLQELFGEKSCESKEMTFFFEPMEMDEDETETITNSKEFIQGQSISAFYTGMYTVLINAGIDVESAITIVTNEQALRYNKELAEINSFTSIEVAKHRAVQIDNTQM